MNLKSLTNLVYEDEPEIKPKSQPQPNMAATTPPPGRAVVLPTIATTDVIDQEMIDTIRGKLATCPEQITINKLTTVMESLRRFIPDEKQRYQAALEQMKLSGIHPEDIGKAFDGLAQRLSEQSQKFEAACSAQRDDLGPKQTALEVKKDLLRSKQAEVDQLRSEIADATTGLAAQAQKITNAEQKFTAAAEKVRADISFAGQQVRKFTGGEE